ncbi:hypothetical protein G6F57_023296 [Rhizopus arrhizus]|nr:hypothetical protein G6F40_017661 [Rhizopus arrhizus]KAG1426726.1 hypothetical protein G6F57_023296 [Rhizopus arrhizus]
MSLMPASVSVGTSGSSGVRASPVMARAFSLPALIWFCTAPRFWNDTLTWPPIRSAIAAPPPLWSEEPVPDDA